MSRVAVASAFIAGAILLTACAGPEEPKLADQASNTFAQAYKAADKARYELVTAKVAGARISESLGHKPSDLPDGYEAWTVCWHEASYVEVNDEKDSFWAIDFYLVAEGADCEDGRLDRKVNKEYEKRVEDASKAVEVERRKEADKLDSEEPESSEDDATSSCHSPTWGSYSCDTGLPAPDERNPDGSYKYTVCAEGEEALNPKCYPYYDELQRWSDTHA
ncbi:hypothetical protein [Streptomyces atroolivaceus]|uniref:hypothetical protein n=1 Tax=Streptomyces atroolivaceus TaxID=66869 RepID=UPI0037878637